ncbi:SDR family oxidoreductase [Sphingobium subterraneum]|uniref:SDR family oxidoreductase n=1 Tax=Sphingobium subterraneum TaxID=627688 RepID=UPI0016162202
MALVTGSSRGIGAAIAVRLAADGAKVVVHAGANTQRGEEVVAHIRDSGGVADLLSGDLSERDAPARLVNDAFAFHGALDILVNNAAVSNYRLLVDHNIDTVDFELALNQRAVILACCEFARLTQSAHGRIINISSCAGHHSAYGRSVYAATKGAMESFTRSIAQELGERGITVNAVAPGTTVTDLFEENERADTRDWRALFARWTALRRVGEPSDIADIVAFVASDDARWLTGVTIPADGGLVTTGINIATYAG